MAQELTFADLYIGSIHLCRRLGVRRLTIATDTGRPIATFERRPGLDRIGNPSPHPGDVTANVSLVLYCRNRFEGAKR